MPRGTNVSYSAARSIIAWIGFQAGNRLSPMRVLRDIELEGLDGPELGTMAYPDFSLGTAWVRIVFTGK
jgi:hypothetical protein